MATKKAGPAKKTVAKKAAAKKTPAKKAATKATAKRAPRRVRTPGSASAPLAGASSTPSELASLAMTREPFRHQKASWARGKRFPVSLERFAALKADAVRHEQLAAAPVLEDDAVDEDIEALAVSGANPTEFNELAPSTISGFDGPGHTRWQPPDCTVATGPRDVLVAVNTDLVGYDKATGAQRFRWADFTQLFGNVLPSGAGLFDPRVAYDHYANRWIAVLASTRDTPVGAWILLGVSQGADPAGAWWVWAADASVDGSNATSNWADYPMLGFDTQAIYITGNMFDSGPNGFQYAKLRIFNKAEVYGGGTGANHFIRWWDFWNLTNPDGSKAFTVQPAVHFQGLGGNPNAYLVNGEFSDGDSLTLWTVGNPLGMWTGGAPTLTRTGVPVASYALAPDAIQRDGGTSRIATNDTRLLNAVFQSNSGTQRLWTSHTIAHTWPGENEARSIIRWYEIDVPSQSIVQSNGFGRAGAYYYFPAIQTDIGRNAHLVFGRSSENEYAHSRQTGRRTTDPPNDLQGSAAISTGLSAYTGGRWGDYFGICRDPADRSVVWMFGEHADSGGQWATRVASTRF